MKLFSIATVLWLCCCEAVAAGAGLTGEYYDNSDFTGLKFTRVDPLINFNWGIAAPSNTMSADTFSVRWSGQVEPRYSETYTFYVAADDGARLWVNDRLLLARTTYSASALEMSGRIDLQAGNRYNLVLEFMEGSGNAQVSLAWSSASQPKEIIPPTQLYPATAVPERGSLLVEYWMNVPGTNVSDMTGLGTYPNRPDARDFLIGFQCLQTNWAEACGTRVSGWVVPPADGNYTFAVAAADSAQLFLSPDASAPNKLLIASNTAPTGPGQYTTFPGQVSGTVLLVTHQQYYIELVHKAGAGPDYFSVAWKPPGSTNWAVVPAEAVVPGGVDRAPPAQTAYLDTLCPSHPRLLTSPAKFEWLKRTLASNSVPQLTSWWVSLSNSAFTILSQPANVYTPDNRGTILNISRSVLDRIYKLGLVWRMTGNTSFAERAWAELDQVASTNFPDWHPAHFLDTAEMTHASAIGYDWLYEYWTQSRRDTIRTAIVNKGLNPVLTLYTNNSGWVASSGNNWNLVCNGGMILGALAVGTENEALAEYVLYKAVASAGAVMRRYTADNGGWYEGPGYWDYTTDYNMRLMAALETALGSDYGLSDTRAVWETGLEPMYMVGPIKLSFNFADAGAGNMRGPQLFWLARRYNRPEFSWYERSNGSGEAMDLLWYDTRGAAPQTAGLQPDNYFRGPTGTTPYFPADAVTLRTRWQDAEAAFVGFKSGEIGASHGHLDAGSFVFDALGIRWAHDLGGDDYALAGYFSTPQRWTYYRLRGEGHNTLVINPGTNADQVVGAKPPVILYTSEPNAERGAVVADLSSAYGLARAWRGIQLVHNRRWLLVQDELQAATPANVWWFMHMNTNTAVAVDPAGTSVTLSQGTDRLWVSILSGGGDFAVSNAVPLPTSPNPPGQNANTAFRKLAIHLPAVTNTTLAVLMVPLIPGQSPPTNNLPVVVPLSAWGSASINAIVTPTNTPPTANTTNVFTTPGAPIDVDLRRLSRDSETAASAFNFTVFGAANGAVTLLPDGHTARFAPANGFAGLGSFRFAVTDTWPDPRLLVHYDFEPPESVADGAITDRSGHDLYGVFTTVGSGTNWLDPEVPPLLAPQTSQSLGLREAGDFNGSRLAAPVNPADLDFDYHDWTVAGWFKRAATTNDDFVFYLGNSDGFGSPDEFQVYCPNGATTLKVSHHIATSTVDVDLTAANVRTGEWHHFAAVFHSTNANSGTVSLYVDGLLAGIDSSATLNMPSGMAAIFGGHASSSFAVTRWFNGKLDDLAVFNAALSASEIGRIATRPVANLGGASATNTVWINVLGPNRPPTLAGASNRVIIAASQLAAQLVGSDPDAPKQMLVYRLLSAPPGASIDAVSGLCAWRPPLAFSGTSNLFTVAVSEAGWATNLSAAADAYVRDGTYVSTNFGSDTNLEVKLASPGLARESYLRFPVFPMLGSLAEARLELTPVYASMPATQLLACVTNNAWSEPELTWQNRLASGPAIGAWLPESGVRTRTMVTASVARQQAGEGVVSLRVYATNSTSDGLVRYGSREAGPSLAPVLVLTSTNSTSLSSTQDFWVTVAAPPAPVVTSATLVDGGCQLRVEGIAGPDYLLLGSTNLADWSVLCVTNPSVLPFHWTDPDTNNYPARFYRVQLGP